MVNHPTVTVVIPAYRAAGTIHRPIESLLAQTRRPEEILVIDDGSPDDLAAAVARYGAAVTLVRKPNGGAASARNTGLDRARGDWIAFLDADDSWEPTKLERQLDVLRMHPDVDLVSSRWFEEWPGESRRSVSPGTPQDSRFYGRVLKAAGEDVFRVAMLLWTSTVLVRKSLVGAMRFESGLEPAEDRDMWVRLVGAGRVYLLPDHLATYVQDAGSLSNSNIDRDCGNMLRVVRRYSGLMGSRATRQWEAYVFRRWAAGLLGSGRAAAAVSPALKRLRLSPFSPQAWWVAGKSLALAKKNRTTPPRPL